MTTNDESNTVVATGFWPAYLASLETRPVATKAATSGCLYGLQEIIALLVTRTINQQSALKTLKMILYGFFVSGPLGHYLFTILEKTFNGKTGALFGILKLLSSNLLISPTLNACYLYAIANFSGANHRQAIQIVKQRLFGMMKISWVVFPLVQTYAFKNLQPSQWLPFFNFVAFLFGTFINIQAKLEAKRKAVNDSKKK